VYHHLRGELSNLTPTSVVLEVNGVAYDLRIPLSTYEGLKGKTQACLFTHLYVREDDMRLFGFGTTAERELFRFLLSVNGVGPSIALASLCALAPGQVVQAIEAEDHEMLQKIKGVGKKLAGRLVVELKDRNLRALLGVGDPEPGSAREGAAGSRPEKQRSKEALDAVAALVTIGFERKSAQERVDAVCRRLEGQLGPGNAGVERLIKECLRNR